MKTITKKIPRIVIAATQSGSGKTTVVTGILSALKERGLKVQAYKIGPDYIDPSYHEIASGRKAHNLDTWLVSEEKLTDIFVRTAGDADIAIIEGVMGLYDGGKNGISSTAAIAKLLDAPVLLVINARSMGDSAAALALGFKLYDEDVSLNGVILNALGSLTHKKMIEEALTKIKIPVMGAIFRDDELKMPERHLGLLPATENKRETEVVQKIGKAIASSIDLENIIAVAQSATPLTVPQNETTSKQKNIKLAVAKDEAFSFYYPESLQVLEDLGAEIINFSPLHDKEIPDVDGIILGGGFPEIFAINLAKNMSMKKTLYALAGDGMPIYAECGGFMYLMEELIDFEGKSHQMVGIIKSKVQMNKKLQTVGYVLATMLQDTILGEKGTVLKGHEFHFSSECIKEQDETKYPYAFSFSRTRAPKPYLAGYAHKNILGSYLHLHFAGAMTAAKHFIDTCLCYHVHKEG